MLVRYSITQVSADRKPLNRRKIRDSQKRVTRSYLASAQEPESIGRRNRRSAVTERSYDGVEHHIQLLAHVFGKEAQHQIAVLLQQLVLTPVSAVRDGIREMLCTVQLHRHTRIGTQEIDFQCPETVERNRQRDVDAETPLGLRQGLQSPEEERFRRAPRSVGAIGV